MSEGRELPNRKAIRQIIELAGAPGKYATMIIDYVPENKIAGHIYEKLGFKPTGEITNGEIVLKLSFSDI